MQKVDIFTRNHVELAANPTHSNPETVDTDVIEALALRFVNSGSTIVIRAGERECFVASGSCSSWLPPYYKPIRGAAKQLSSRIVSPTCAGNAFIGAFTISFLETHDLDQAACYGNVGAIIAVEQFVLPELRENEEGKVWNDVNPYLRLREYMTRLEVDC